MKQISILGCGWLGLPLAKSLIAKGNTVKGSTTTTTKIPQLKEAGINPFVVEVTHDGVSGEIEALLENSEILIIDIPPKLRTNSGESFVKRIQNLLPFIQKEKVSKVIFISSTSVYDDAQSIITEATIANPNTESGKQLLQAEHLLSSHSHDFSTTIIRFGGLFGEDRHPVHYLSGRQNLENPNAPINLIHQVDCIGIIEKIIEEDFWNQTLNAVAPFHPTRKEYYTEKASALGLPLPQFASDDASSGKIIQSDKITTELQYTFQKPNL